MGRYNNKRTQQAAEAMKHTPSRARFSKGPPNKSRNSKGKSNRNNRNETNSKQQQQRRTQPAAAGRVIDKIASRTAAKNNATASQQGGTQVASTATALAYVDKSKLDRLSLSEDVTQMVRDLLTNLGVVESKNNKPSSSSPLITEEQEASDLMDIEATTIHELDRTALDAESLYNHLSNANEQVLHAQGSHIDEDDYHEEEEQPQQQKRTQSQWKARRNYSEYNDDEEENSGQDCVMSETVGISYGGAIDDTIWEGQIEDIGGMEQNEGYYHEQNKQDNVKGDDQVPAGVVNKNDESTDMNKDENYEDMSKNNHVFIRLTTQLSFSDHQAARACRAIEDWDAVVKADDEAEENKNKNVTSNAPGQKNKNSVSLAIDWLCLHLTQEELTNGLKPNKNKLKDSTSPVLFGNASMSNRQVRAIPHPSISIAKSITSDKEWIRSMRLQQRVSRFLLLGFSESEATQACEETMMNESGDNDGDADKDPLEDTATMLRLLAMLEQTTIAEDSGVATASGKKEELTPTDLAYAAEEQESERQALEAIYEDQFVQVKTIQSSDSSQDCDSSLMGIDRYLLSITPAEELREPVRSHDCKLHVFLRKGYPVVEPPLVFFANQSLGPTLLRRINTELVRTLSSMTGTPVVFEIVTFLSERVPSMQLEYIEEQRHQEEQATQRKLQAASQKDSNDYDGNIGIDDDSGHLGRRQRAKLKALEKAFDRPEQLQKHDEERRKRQEKRLDQVRQDNNNFRDNLAHKAILKREEEKNRQEAERAARRSMNDAFNRGKSVEEARAEARRARLETLREFGLVQKENEDLSDKRDERKVNSGDTGTAESHKTKDETASPTPTSAAFMNRLQETVVTSDLSTKSSAKSTPKTMAFMDRLRKMYDDAVIAQTGRGGANLAAAGDGDRDSAATEKGTLELEAYQLNDPTETDEQDKTDNSSKNEESQSAIDRRLPRPVAVPTGELADVMKSVICQQRDQPWLVFPEARAPTVTAERDSLTPEHHRRQVALSKTMRQDLERKRKSANNWAIKNNNAAQEGKGSYKKKSGFTPQKFHAMMTTRQRLPAYKMAEEIVETISTNQITVVAGDTGCGKTTQVPQLVLDHLIMKNEGATANIIVTQPRRISAIGVSERIADERCERVGETCGYSIKLEKKMSSKTRLLLCTTGILLRRLQCDPDLASVSHVFVDEVHERDLNTDFLIIILKDLLVRRKNLKLVLMSATLNSEAFSSYFDGCPIVSIPGRAHPVQENRLEDILELTKYQVQEDSDYALKTESNRSPRFSKSALRKMYFPKYSKETIHSLSIVDETVINYELLSEVLEYICLNNEEGAILVFMPGMMEIQKAIEEMYKKELFQTSKVVIYPLHSSLSTAEQTAIFDLPPTGVRKIVVATNIAETSITIEDVVYVVDTGRVKENRKDEMNETPTLVECWVSRASAKQRRGRAGRVRPGIAYHMYSSHTLETDIQDYQLPEMLRVGIEDLVLQILILDLGEPTSFLSKALNPPSDMAMSNSLKLLETLGAVDCIWQNDNDTSKAIGKDRGSAVAASCANLSVSTELTALGFNLATLPVDPRVGKMMIYGALFGCIDPALTIAASMSARSPFVSPFDKRDEADAARKKFASDTSDHLTILNAFVKWKKLRQRKTNGRAVQAFLHENFLSRLVLSQMEDLRKQFANLLTDIGFLRKEFRLHDTEGPENVNSNNLGLIKAILCAGLYPNIIVAPRTVVCNNEATQPKNAKSVGECAFQSQNKGAVYLHPCTIAFTESKLASRYCCYHEIVKTSKTYVRDCTTVSPFALLLFGGDLEVNPTKGVCAVDGWLKFCIDPQPAILVKYLRLQMERILLRKIVVPEEDVTGSPDGKALVQSINVLIERETEKSNQMPPDRSGGEIVRPWTGSDETRSTRNHSRDDNRKKRGGRGGRGRNGRGRQQGGRGRRGGGY